MLCRSNGDCNPDRWNNKLFRLAPFFFSDLNKGRRITAHILQRADPPVPLSEDGTEEERQGRELRQAAKALGGGGGGKPDLAQGGGPNVARLDEAPLAGYKTMKPTSRA